MSLKFQKKVEQFHRKIGATVNHIPTKIDLNLRRQRHRIIFDELEELREAMSQNNLVSVADALADLEYAILGTAIVYGIDLEPVFDQVHRSNMTKDAPPTKDGKGVKGKQYSPPNISKILADLKKDGG